MWSLFFVGAGSYYYFSSPVTNPYAPVLLAMVGLWGVRLSAYITWRNHGMGEDYRYKKIREKWSPHYWIKSLGIVFTLQAVLAWIISMPLYFMMTTTPTMPALMWTGLGISAAGFLCESIGDYQLSRFLANPDNKGKVCRDGLWNYT